MLPVDGHELPVDGHQDAVIDFSAGFMGEHDRIWSHTILDNLQCRLEQLDASVNPAQTPAIASLVCVVLSLDGHQDVVVDFLAGSIGETDRIWNHTILDHLQCHLERLDAAVDRPQTPAMISLVCVVLLVNGHQDVVLHRLVGFVGESDHIWSHAMHERLGCSWSGAAADLDFARAPGSSKCCTTNET